MDLIGIGVLVFGIAFAILVIFLIIVLRNLTSVLSNVDKTVEKLPSQLDDVMKNTESILNSSNTTIDDLNEKMGALSPLFYIIGDAGEATRKVSSSLVDVTASMKKNTTEGNETTKQKDLGGIYGAAALGYYLFQKRKALKEGSGQGNASV